ncbi:hypothetical protein NECAME_17521, partial [Necator americanus]
DWKRSVNTKCCAGGFCLVDPSDDWNTNPPSCILCKKPVSMCLNKALEYNASGRMELDNKTGSGFTSRKSLFFFIHLTYNACCHPHL